MAKNKRNGWYKPKILSNPVLNDLNTVNCWKMSKKLLRKLKNKNSIATDLLIKRKNNVK